MYISVVVDRCCKTTANCHPVCLYELVAKAFVENHLDDDIELHFSTKITLFFVKKIVPVLRTDPSQ